MQTASCTTTAVRGYGRAPMVSVGVPPFRKELVTQSGSTCHGGVCASASRAASNGSMRCHPGIPVGFLRVGALDHRYGLVRRGEVPP